MVNVWLIDREKGFPRDNGTGKLAWIDEVARQQRMQHQVRGTVFGLLKQPFLV